MRIRQPRRKTREYFTWLKAEKPVPVHYQEPFRRGYGTWEPKASDFVEDAKAAKTSGAAGWCFHNGAERNQPNSQPRRGFDLREKALFEQLDEVELEAVSALQKLFDPVQQ
jgi:hypothetical protein